MRDQVKTLSFSSYQLTNAASSSTIWVLSNGSEFLRPENLNKPTTKGESINIAELSLLKEFLEEQLCSCYVDVRGGLFAYRHMAVA